MVKQSLLEKYFTRNAVRLLSVVLRSRVCVSMFDSLSVCVCARTSLSHSFLPCVQITVSDEELAELRRRFGDKLQRGFLAWADLYDALEVCAQAHSVCTV